MKDLLWMIAVGSVAAVVGFAWQAQQQEGIGPAPVTVMRGDRLDGGDSAGSGGPTVSRTLPGSGSADGSGSAVDPPRFGPRPKASGHIVVTIAKPKLTRHADGLIELNLPFLANYKAMLPQPGKPEARPMPAPIPSTIQELDGKRVRIRGFMIALQVEQEKCVRFLLSRYSFEQCCYGLTPEPNEYIVVSVPPEHATPPIAEGTIVVTGRMAVGPDFGPQKQLNSLFRIEATDVRHIR